VLYRWKKEHLARSGPVASSLKARVKELEGQQRTGIRCFSDGMYLVYYWTASKGIEVV